MSGLSGLGRQNRTPQVQGLLCQSHTILDKDCNLDIPGSAKVTELRVREDATVKGNATVCGDLVVKGNIVGNIEGGGAGGIGPASLGWEVVLQSYTPRPPVSIDSVNFGSIGHIFDGPLVEYDGYAVAVATAAGSLPSPPDTVNLLVHEFATPYTLGDTGSLIGTLSGNLTTLPEIFELRGNITPTVTPSFWAYFTDVGFQWAGGTEWVASIRVKEA